MKPRNVSISKDSEITRDNIEISRITRQCFEDLYQWEHPEEMDKILVT
jgi:hypothetical protein